jgi:hypothetical protein
VKSQRWYQELGDEKMTGTSGTVAIKESLLVLLHYPMLTRSNYTTWAIKMKVFMHAQGVWDSVKSDDSNDKLDVKKDQTALAAIYQGIPNETLQVVSEKKTAKEAWECIRTMYQGAQHVKDARIQTLREELDALRMKSTDSVDDFAMKVNLIVSTIRGLGENIEDWYVVRKILRATLNKLLQIVASIEQFGDMKMMSIEEVIGRLRAYEERLCCSDDADDGAEHLLLTKVQWKATEKKDDEHLLLTRAQWRAREEKEGTDGSSGSGSAGKNRKFDKAKVRCYKCNNYDHFQWECDELKEEKALFIAPDDDNSALL